MNQEHLAKAIIDAAHILANNGALTPEGAQLGGLEAHSMKIAKSIDNLAYAMQGIAEEMARIADVIERNSDA